VPQLLLAAGLLLPLGLDTFALAAALGLAGLEPRDRLRVTLVFTTFETVMPIVGLVLGHAVGNLIGEWAGYIAIAFLVIAGLLLLKPGQKENDEEQRLRLLAHARGVAIFYLGLSISLDELTVGLSAGLLALPIAIAIVWIAVQAFAVTQLGLHFGSRIGETLRERSEQAAGLALIALALLLLLLRFTARI
jgi:manganese efflux pump family protein